ncbi:MAG: GMC family oxidoreductase, partial [Deltaproteobacteria bacterium]|nr:GMC family oxidoreductase [Deltaproteobacteria bacterium]
RMIIDSSLVLKDLREECDVCVIGSGAGGAVVAKELSCAGLRVILLEEGSHFKPEDFYQETWRGLSQLYVDYGLRSMFGKSYLPTMHARCLGGTTVVNSGISFRLPEKVLNEWKRDFGVNHDYAKLSESFDRTGKITNIAETEPDVYGNHNVLFKKGCEALGLKAAPIKRNMRNCNGCGFCMMGCPNYAHLSMELSYIPIAVENGCRVYTDCRAEFVVERKGRAAGVRGRFLDKKTKKPTFDIEIKAKAVVVSCGAIGSPFLLLKSGIANKNKMVGKCFLNHPGAAVKGVFEERVEMWKGAPQGFECDDFLDEGFLIETAALPAELAAMRVPGEGAEFKRRFSLFANAATWGVMVRAKTEGRVYYAAGKPWLFYPLKMEDLRKLQRGLKIIADIFFAAGAKMVMPGLRKVPPELHDPKETYLIENEEINQKDLYAIGNHPMGGCRMGEDPSKSVVSSSCESHEVKDLYVCDASVFPTALGVNPQWSIMAFADHAAQGMKEKYL